MQLLQMIAQTSDGGVSNVFFTRPWSSSSCRMVATSILVCLDMSRRAICSALLFGCLIRSTNISTASLLDGICNALVSSCDKRVCVCCSRVLESAANQIQRPINKAIFKIPICCQIWPKIHHLVIGCIFSDPAWSVFCMSPCIMEAA